MSFTLFACFPVCSLFVSLGIIWIIVYLIGAGTDTPESIESDASKPKPPWIVFPITLFLAIVLLLLLSLVTDG
jgi:hypothetical protein